MKSKFSTTKARAKQREGQSEKSCFVGQMWLQQNTFGSTFTDILISEKAPIFNLFITIFYYGIIHY